MKYIIEVEKIEGTDLFKAKGFNTLVFDSAGLSKLELCDEELVDGCVIKTVNGTTLYEFKGYSNEGYINAINLSNNKFVCIPKNSKIVRVK